MVSEAQKSAILKYYENHKEDIASKRREYYKAYNATRPKVELTEEARIARREYLRNYRQRKNESKQII